MGAGDRKSRRGARRGSEEASPADARRFDAAVAKLAAGPEADAQLGGIAPGKLPASQLAHVPSPHRRRAGVPNAPGAPPVEASLGTIAEAPLAAGSYRDQLRANGQRALQRAWEGGFMPRPGLPPPPPPPTTGPSMDLGGAAMTSPAGGEAAAGQEQYLALCQTTPNIQHALAAPPPPPLAASQGMSPTWGTSPAGSGGFWPEAGLEIQAPVMGGPSLPMPECQQGPQMVPMQPMLPMPLPAPGTPGATNPADGLMAIAMPQATTWMDGEQIAAQLRAAVPVCYED